MRGSVQRMIAKRKAIADDISKATRSPRQWFLPWPYALTSEGWDAWYAEQHRLRPIRAFVGITLWHWWLRQWGRIGRAWYWVKCKTLPSYRYHWLDLRRGDPTGRYTHGWRDFQTTSELALVSLLRDYVEIELAAMAGSGWSREDQAADNEARDIYHWFMFTKPARDKESLAMWRAANRCDACMVFDAETARLTGEKLKRLIEIRESLWT